MIDPGQSASGLPDFVTQAPAASRPSKPVVAMNADEERIVKVGCIFVLYQKKKKWKMVAHLLLKQERKKKEEDITKIREKHEKEKMHGEYVSHFLKNQVLRVN